jgi:hypothetical protein
MIILEYHVILYLFVIFKYGKADLIISVEPMEENVQSFLKLEPGININRIGDVFVSAIRICPLVI